MVEDRVQLVVVQDEECWRLVQVDELAQRWLAWLDEEELDDCVFQQSMMDEDELVRKDVLVVAQVLEWQAVELEELEGEGQAAELEEEGQAAE